MKVKKKDFILFLLASAMLGVSQSIDNSVLNNFLNDTFHMEVMDRALLEIPRELPGFLVVFISGMLMFLGDIRIAAVSNIIAAFGMFLMGFISKEYSTVVLCLVVYSTGQHLYMPISNSIAMNLSDKENMGKRLGQINALNTAAFLGTSLITAFIFKYIKVNYKAAFVVGATALLIAGVLIMLMTPYKNNGKPKKLVLKKQYSLFYCLSIIFGARKQIFITFGPWVLIKVFDQGVSTFAVLGFIVAGSGIFIKPLIGIAIDRLGEKFVLKSEAIVLIIICTGYALAEKAFGDGNFKSLALIIVCACFVIDQVITAAGMARATYLKKIAVSPEDVSPTLSMGISMDHVVSMFIPYVGSYVWQRTGYEFVFLGGALIALVNFIVVSRMKFTNEEKESSIPA